MFLIRFVKVVNKIKNPYTSNITFDYKHIGSFYLGSSPRMGSGIGLSALHGSLPQSLAQ